LISLFAACSSDGDGTSSSDAQTPPTSGRADIEQWLSAGSYKTWACEPTIHASRDPSPHGFNRICSNDVIAGVATGTNAWPKGASAVKELYTSMTATTPAGYAVYLKTDAASADGVNWYWYERVPASSDAPKDANGIVADGKGGSGAALTICVGCHKAAGADSSHTPSPGGRDQVYTPVQGM
jgi:cytochrome c553